MELWQILLADKPDINALIALCEGQESVIEDLRYELEEEKSDNRRYDKANESIQNLLVIVRDERDELQNKLDSVQKMLEEVDDMGCGLEYINEILNLFE